MLLQRNKLLNITTLISILIFVLFLVYIPLVGLFPYYFHDGFIFIAFTVFFYFSYKHWNLNLPVFTLLMLGFILHMSGVFGWYNISPVPLQWDHITHFVPMFAFTCLFFGFAHRFMNRNFLTKKNFTLFAIILLAGLGCGSIIEITEFAGFLANGFGEGGFYFGTGDAFQGQEIASIEQIEEFGGGWFNTMWDIIWNAIGALSALIVMSFAYFVFRRKERNLFDEY